MAETEKTIPHFSMLVINCGSMVEKFNLVRRHSTRKTAKKSATSPAPQTITTRTVQVNSETQCVFDSRTCSSNLSEDLKFDETDAFVIFYDMTRPNTVAIYDSFIRSIIGSKKKSVRIIGIQPDTSNKSIRKKSRKSKNISAGWGRYHQVVVDRADNERELLIMYRDMAAELLGVDTKTKSRKKEVACTIL